MNIQAKFPHTFNVSKFPRLPNSTVKTHKKASRRYNHTKRSDEPGKSIVVRRIVEAGSDAFGRLHSRRSEEGLEFCG